MAGLKPEISFTPTVKKSLWQGQRHRGEKRPKRRADQGLV
jgi:hypothetical protein